MPRQEPEAFATPGQLRARNERTILPARTWTDLPAEAAGTRVSRASVTTRLAAEGVTTRAAKARLREHARGAIERAGKEMPRGQDFYSDEQAGRIDETAKHFGVPFHVALAVNAIMSPKTSLATATGLQTNREAAHHVLNHVISGKAGPADTKGLGLRANVRKATEVVRQYLENGTHPLDAVDAKGQHLVSGPKVEEYYSSYVDPHRAPTDIQHARILFGPGVRSEMSPEEIAHKNTLVAQYGKNSPEVGRYIPKSPAEQLISHGGVHEWAAHVTSQVAQEFNMHPAEFQSMLWHEHKTRRGGRSAVQEQMRPLFDPRGAQRKKAPKPPEEQKLFSLSEFRGHGG
jgi:hypothetical protein